MPWMLTCGSARSPEGRASTSRRSASTNAVAYCGHANAPSTDTAITTRRAYGWFASSSGRRRSGSRCGRYRLSSACAIRTACRARRCVREPSRRSPRSPPRSDSSPRYHCFGYTRARLTREGDAGVAFVSAEVNARRCACDLKNPSGRCCLGDLRQFLRHRASKAAAPARSSVRRRDGGNSKGRSEPADAPRES